MADTRTYEYRVVEDYGGWWNVEWQFAYDDGRSGSWHVVARVAGEKRAEIVRDALSEEANERV